MICIQFDITVIQDAIQNRICESIKKRFQDTIKPFEDDIHAEGGKVTFVVPKDLENINLKIDGLSKELVDRIRKAF